jgi:hypothetical protein
VSGKEEVTLWRLDWYSQLLGLGETRHVVDLKSDPPQCMSVGDINVEMRWSDIDFGLPYDQQAKRSPGLYRRLEVVFTT